MAKIFGSAVQQTVVTPNEATFRVEVVTLALVGTPQQFPSISVPDGKDLVIVAHKDNKKDKIFIADSSANALDNTKRKELEGGEGIGLGVNNANVVWFDGQVNGLKVEIMVEQ